MMKFGYCLVIVTVLLMFWISSLQAREIDPAAYPPCTFNPLCKCSKAQPDLGIVQCRNVPFSVIPRTINSSKVFMLQMDNTGLQLLEPYFLQATGLYRLELSNNPLADVHDDSFVGLERSLWELYLAHNELIEVPTKALRYLQKLKTLDLSGNKIDTIEKDSWRGLEATLQMLYLRDNYISSLPSDGFSALAVLDTLDLSSNNLRHIDGSVFRDGMERLSKLILADNLLPDIPYQQLSPLKALRTLDMSYNRIASILPPTDDALDVKFNLDTLHLDFNQITVIASASFKYFDSVNKTYLDGNAIDMVQDSAFRNAKIRELYLRHCSLDSISPDAFGGLEKSLQVLDMSGNNLTDATGKWFQNFDYLRSLSLKNNLINQVTPRELFSGVMSTLSKLDLSGEGNAETDLQDLKRMRSLRSLAISKLPIKQLSSEDFLDFSTELEDLKLSQSSIQSIGPNAFKNVRGLRRIDLSNNRISKIDGEAFSDLGHSLIALKISHGLSADNNVLQAQLFRQLSSLQSLDLSNNYIKSIPETSFHFMKSIQSLNLVDNQIDQIAKGTFQGDIHSRLETILFSFNAIKYIAQHTFVDLGQLRRLDLADNRIEKLERRGFMNLESLQTLSLRGNKISSISDEAFQNLPEVEHIDLAYNSMNYFDFDYLDQVGTLSSLKVNISHNKISQLVDNSSNFGFTKDHCIPVYHSNIKILDLSYNNVSDIQGGYFKPVEISLTHLYLSNNKLKNTSRSVLGNLIHLQWLDLSNNIISWIDYDTFRNTRKLQYLDLSDNLLSAIPDELFKLVNGLRILNLRRNYLKSLPENLIFNEGLERIDLSHNQFTKIPASSITNLAALTVCDVDLSDNHIGTIHAMDFKFRSLTRLDLSGNNLVRLEDAGFSTLPHLMILNLGHNSELEISAKVFIGLENSLLQLNLDNVSITAFPDLPLPFLRRLSIAYNELPFVPPELATNMTTLNYLDLSYNDLTNVPLLTHSLPKLQHLSLAGNPISVLTNTSLIGAADTLKTLDIANLQLNTFEAGALQKMNTLQSLVISCYPQVTNFNLPTVLDNVNSLRYMQIKSYGIQQRSSADAPPSMHSDCDLRKEMVGDMPSKLRHVEFSGRGFHKLAENLFSGIRSPFLKVTISNTSISTLPTGFFSNLGSVRNISLDLSQNNKQLKGVPNPNTASIIQLPEKVFLTSLRLGSNSFDCDCSLGWIEFWHRKKRQFLCNVQSWSSDVFGSSSHWKGDGTQAMDICEDDQEVGIRETECSNKKNENLMEILKSELECGWGSAGHQLQKVSFVLLIASGLLLWF